MDRSGQPAGPPGVCPFTVDRPVMRQRWERLTFLHWPFEPAAVQRLIPGSLRVETFGGAAWVGLVPFLMRVRTPGGRGLPWVSNFCETNVRTYVTDRDGRPGIWFLSLDAARLGAVTVARTTYRLPYFWSRMRLAGGGCAPPGSAPGGTEGGQDPGGDCEVGYSCRRRWPGPRGVASRARIRAGAPLAPGELGDRDHFLTARWILFSVHGARARFARACHQPWPLHRARLLDLDDGLLPAAGLPRPEGEPLIHYSPGVDVRIGWPETYR